MEMRSAQLLFDNLPFVLESCQTVRAYLRAGHPGTTSWKQLLPYGIVNCVETACAKINILHLAGFQASLLAVT